MKIKLNIKSTIFMALIAIASLLFINISFAANTGKVMVETAKLREQANTDSKVLELASQGEEVEILKEEDEWYKVKYKQVTGYIRKDLIQVNNKDAANTNESTKENETQNTTENTVENTTENTVENTTENTQEENNKTIEKTDTNKTENVEEITKNQKYKITDDVKIKVIPLISSIELEEVKKDSEVEVVEILNDWVKVKTSNEKEGWVRKEKLTTIKEETTSTENNTTKTEDTTKNTTNETQTSTETTKTQETNTTKTMYVNSQSVNLRQKADKTSQVIKSLTLNTKVTVLSSTNGWAYVDVNGTKGYIAENLLTSTKKETSRSGLTTREQKTTSTTESTTTNTTSNANTTTSNTTASASASSVVSYAKQYLGCKYVYGGTSPSGFDCSGFTQYVYKHFGVNLNRTAAAQYSNGQSVTNLQAGDLVMFGKSGINHVGIYIGGNTFIHAANPSKGVRTDSMSTGYYKTNYVGARRIF